MSLIDTAEFFSKSLIPTITGRNNQRRVPFQFTSTKRLIDSGSLGVAKSREFAKKSAADSLKRELQTIDGNTILSDTVSTLGLSSVVSALSTTVISMAVNPNTIRWSQGKRHVKRDTMNGSVFFHFINDNGQNNDILQLQFTGSTGNINTQNGLDTTTAVGGDLKLRMWHELYNLSREPVLLDGGVKNDFFITYRTVLMPMPITFIGFFDKVLEFTETANQPFARDYSFGFTVTSTSPDLDSIKDMLNNSLSVVGPISSLRQAGAISSLPNTVTKIFG